MKFLLFLQIILFIQSTSAQQSKLSKAVNNISEYLASDQFINLKNIIGDIAATDSIYKQALDLTGNDYAEALLALMFATVPYRKVPIQLPLVNIIIYYPLTSADEKTFLHKNENLPRYFFLDSPDNEYGDKDKLAHFFGSAFLSYQSHIFDLGELIGYFVEAFEESFKVQSAIDHRDLHVNEYGRLFGKILQKDKSIMPSQLLLLRSFSFIRIIL